MGLLNLVGRLSLDGAPFKQGLDKSKRDAQGAASDISNSLKGMVMGAVGGLTIATQFKEAFEYAEKLVDLSARTGVGTGVLQEISFGAGMTGSSLESMIPILKRIAISKKEALADPTGEIAESFASMGIGIDQLKASRVEDVFFRIGKAFEDAGDSQSLFADGMKVTGKSGDELVQVFRGGFSEAVENFRKLDMSISDEKLKSIEKYGDKYKELGEKIKWVFTGIVGGVAKAHESLAGMFDSAANEMVHVIDFANAGGMLSGASYSDFRRLRINQELENADANMAPAGPTKPKGPSLKDVMGGVKFEGGSNKEMDGIIRMQERINEMKFSALTDDQKRPALLKQIEEYEMRIALIRAGRFLGIGGTPKDILQQELNIAEAQAKLAGLIKKDKTKELSPLKDSLTSVGNFLGANPNSGQMKEFSEMNRKLDAIVRNTARTGGSIFPQ